MPFQAFLQLSTVRFYSFSAPKAPPQILHPKKGPIPPYTLDEAMYMLQRTRELVLLARSMAVLRASSTSSELSEANRILVGKMLICASNLGLLCEHYLLKPFA